LEKRRVFEIYELLTGFYVGRRYFGKMGSNGKLNKFKSQLFHRNRNGLIILTKKGM
jgi:hypothetical protein